MQYADKNTTYIQNNEKLKKTRFFTNFKNRFLKFVKFAFSIYDLE